MTRWRAIIQEDGPVAILGYCYSSHQGQFNRWLLMALFRTLGTTRLLPGTVCEWCSDAAWEATLGPVGGADPESVVHSDLIVAWSCDLATTAVHSWAKIEAARRAGAQLVVPRRSRTAAQADWHVAPRIGTAAALALGLMHMLVPDGLCDRGYLARETIGFHRLEQEVLPRFGPERVEAITGVPHAHVERNGLPIVTVAPARRSSGSGTGCRAALRAGRRSAPSRSCPARPAPTRNGAAARCSRRSAASP